MQQELLAARRELETRGNQILSLEAALLARPELPADAPESEKDKLIESQSKTLRELEIVVKGYEENLGEPLRAVKEDVEKEWTIKLEEETRLREEKEAWANELARELEKEKKLRVKLEGERRALAAFVSKFDSLGLGGLSFGGPSSPVKSMAKPPMPSPGGATAKFTERQQNKANASEESPLKLDFTGGANGLKSGPSLLEQMPEEEWSIVEDMSFDERDFKMGGKVPSRERKGKVDKENMPA